MNLDPEIPLISFHSYIYGSAHDRELMASAIDAALSSTGFIYLSNHGIDLQKIKTAFNWSKRFFELPLAQKCIAKHSIERSHHRGYSGLGHEKVRESVCMKEAFDSGNPDDEEQPNTWPPDELLHGFQEFMDDFFGDCSKLVAQLLDCLSLALNLASSDSLARYHASSMHSLSLLHYPAVSAKLLRSGAITRIPAHSDFGTLTLLFQDDIGGLEIAVPDSADTVTSIGFEKGGKFRHVEPKPETVVVNVGYLLMRWSNGRWKNTVHRVVEPPSLSEENGAEFLPPRFSIPFFGTPDSSAVVEALPGCWSEDAPKRWKPINAGDYLRRKRKSVYA